MAAASSSSSSSSSDAMKTLTVGPSRGNIAALVSKTKAIEAKHGPFDALFVTGDFFSNGDELNEDEQNLLEGKLSMPIRTYVAYGRTRPPKRIRELVAAAGGQQATTSNGDRLPIKLADKLYWLGRDQVTWVAKDQADEDAIRRAARAPKAGDDEGVIVDEEAERRGLRVAVCGGSWNAEAWAKEIQGGAAGADGEADKPQDGEKEDEESPYILPSTINRLNSHKAFQPLAPPAAPSSAPAVQHQTLAAARQATQALIAAAASASRSTASSRPHLDILLLPSWPSGISLFSKTFPPSGLTEEARTWGLPALAELARRSCPRYIFAPPAIEAGEETDGVFWEREPYTTSMTPAMPAGGRSAATGANSAMPRPAPAETRTTRFVSLAKAANASKARWFVALNLAFAGSAAATAAPPKGATMSPFGPPPVAMSASKRKAGDDVDEDQGLNSAVNFRWQQRGGRGGGNAKRPRNGHDSSAAAGQDDAPPPAGYTCRICGSSDHYIRLCPHSAQSTSSRSGLPMKPEGAEAALEPLQLGRRKREPVTMVGPADCWFCLSNPQCAKHLVVSIAEGLYVALPKGQLPPPSSTSKGGVPGGGHVLLVPITHAATYAGNSEAARSLRDEMEAHLECLEKMYASYGCGMAAWCVVKLANTRAGHLQVQCVPVPPRKEEGDLLEYVKGQAEERGYELKRVEPDVAPLPAAAGQTEEGGSTRRRRLAAHPSSDEEFFELHISTPSPSTTTSEAPRRTTLLLDLSRPTTGGPPIRFDYQFARTTLAQYLGVPDRADWRACCEGGQEMEAEQTREVRRLWGEWGPQDEADDSDDDDEDEE